MYGTEGIIERNRELYEKIKKSRHIDIPRIPADKNKIVMLPIDPLKGYSYWDLTDETLSKLDNKAETTITLYSNYGPIKNIEREFNKNNLDTMEHYIDFYPNRPYFARFYIPKINLELFSNLIKTPANKPSEDTTEVFGEFYNFEKKYASKPVQSSESTQRLFQQFLQDFQSQFGISSFVRGFHDLAHQKENSLFIS